MSLNALDFGLLLNQGVGFNGGVGDSTVDYEAVLVPRFSFLIGNSASAYVSASFRALYEHDNWLVVPELLRTEFNWNRGSNDFSIGRMVYIDPINLVAAGLFDGVRFSHHNVWGTLGFGLWYTGFLYKNRANIAMTDADTVSVETVDLNWGDFFNTYFASRRVMASLFWEHPSVAERLGFSAALIGQIDLNNDESHTHHSQYIIAKATLPHSRFIFELGGAVELAQITRDDEAEIRIALAGDVGLHWMPVSRLHSMVSFNGRFTSGRTENGPLTAFTPITSLSHGDILQADIPGLSVLTLGYTVRLRHELSAVLSTSYFVRSDRGSYIAYPVNGEELPGYFLGSEFFGRLMWSPISDMSLNVGGGIFLPALGDVAPNVDPLWRIEMSATFALR